MEFETDVVVLNEAGIILCKFTPMEFETGLK